MTVQELINILNKIEDKDKWVVAYYDGWYCDIKEEEIIELVLNTDDDKTNLYDYDLEQPYEKVNCLQIYHGG